MLSSGNLLLVGKTKKKPDQYDSVINAMTYLFGSVRSQGKKNKCREDHPSHPGRGVGLERSLWPLRREWAAVTKQSPGEKQVFITMALGIKGYLKMSF